MKLIVGLGNPGSQYTYTRHNVGFMAADYIGSVNKAKFKLAKKSSSMIAETELCGAKLLLVKPNTYMNLSGRAVNYLAQYYKIKNEDILIMHDEIALPFGTVRTRLDGESAGHNGVESIIEEIGKDFRRIRIGIDNDYREKTTSKAFVLSNFSKQEMSSIDEIFKICQTATEDFIADDFKAHTYKII